MKRKRDFSQVIDPTTDKQNDKSQDQNSYVNFLEGAKIQENNSLIISGQLQSTMNKQ
jgi:hypothetical protein